MRTLIITAALVMSTSTALFAQKDLKDSFSISLPDYYEQSYEQVDEGTTYDVIVEVPNSGNTLIMIQKKGREYFDVHRRDTGEFVEWSPTVPIKRITDVADIIKETIPLTTRNTLVSQNSLKFVFLVSTESGRIEDSYFSMIIKPGTDRALCSIPPSTIIELSRKFAEILEFDVKDEYKKYDYLVAGIRIRFGYNGKILIRKPEARNDSEFSEY